MRRRQGAAAVEQLLQGLDLVEDRAQRLAALDDPAVDRAARAARRLHVRAIRQARQGDDAAARPASLQFEGADGARSSDTIEARHLYVDEEEMICPRATRFVGFEGLLTIFRGGERNTLNEQEMSIFLC